MVGRSREDSFKTLADLPLFGYVMDRVDFRYPSIADLQAMPKDKPIQAVGFKFKKNSNSNNLFGAFQVIMSNGCHSPIFLGKTQTADDL